MKTSVRQDSAVIVFVKTPARGQVKTRLARSLGDAAALEIYRCFVADLLAMLAGMNRVPRIYFHPAEAGPAARKWLGEGYALFPQQGATLGDKMGRALAETFQAGMDKAVLLGSDIPDLPPAIVNEALTALEQRPAVIGPSPDGGYYLIGFTAAGFAPEIFADIPWSTARVFGRTMERFEALGPRPHLLPEWPDIDTVADLRRLLDYDRFHSGRAPRTMACLRSIQIREEIL